MYFTKVICHFLLVCYLNYALKISDKTSKILLNYSNIYDRVVFIGTQTHTVY